MKRILFVTTSDLSGQSGHNIATKEMIAAFGRHPSMDVVLVCPRPQGTLPTHIEKNVTAVYRIKQQQSGSIIEHFLTQLSLIPAMLSAFRSESPDAVVARHSPTMIVPPVLTTLTRRPYILLARGLSHERLRFSWLLTKIFWLNVSLAEQVYPAYNEVQSRVDEIRTDAQSASQLFTNAVDPEKLSPVDKDTARESIDEDIGDSAFVIGFVGSLKRWHKLEALLLSLHELPDDTKVLIVGSGPKEQQLKQLVTDEGLASQVIFAGFVDHDQINTYISASDLAYGAIDPAHDGNAIKCYEYLACERPIITDDRTEFQFVRDNELGVLIQSVTPETIAQAVLEIREKSDEERKEMGKAGRNYIRNNHTWDQLAELVYTVVD